MSVLEWLMQLLVAALLVAAMPFVIRLERRLRALRQDRSALDGSAAGLAEATRTAESASLRLRASAETAGRQVAEALARAEPLRDDLRYLVERAEAVADRLDGLVRAARMLPAPGAAQDLPPEPPSGLGSAGRSRAERDLIRALTGQPPRTGGGGA